MAMVKKTVRKPVDAMRQRLRDRLEALGVEHKALSRAAGKNHSYINQFIYKGVPQKLPEDVRLVVSEITGIPESELGAHKLGGKKAPAPAPAGASKDQVAVHDAQIAAGDGVYIDRAHKTGEIGFDRAWLRTMTDTPPRKLRIIQLRGDSMEPTLPDGAWVMVDLNDVKPVSNKIYVFAEHDEGRVKRIAIHPQTRRLTLISDNPTWPNIEDVDPAAIDIFGRVIWYSKKL